MRDAGGISESDVSTDRRADDAPPQPATIRSCKRWSKQEMSQLKALYDQTLSDDEIAKRLNRSRRAVRTMILRLGGEHIREETRAWTDSECELVLSMHANGASCATIAIAMPERTELAIFRKLSHMVGAALRRESAKNLARVFAYFVLIVGGLLPGDRVVRVATGISVAGSISRLVADRVAQGCTHWCVHALSARRRQEPGQGG